MMTKEQFAKIKWLAKKGPSRELDLAILKAMAGCDPSAWYDEKDDCAGWHEMHDFGSTTASEYQTTFLPHYSTSADIALALATLKAMVEETEDD